MGRTFEALRKAERDRQRYVPSPRVSSAKPSRSLLDRWLGRPEAERREEAELVAWLVGEVRSVGSRIDALEEKLDKRLPEVEGRMLKMLEASAHHVETTVATQLRAGVAAELEARLAAAERRAALGRAGVAIAVLALLLTFALR